jgi:hypothetical protein
MWKSVVSVGVLVGTAACGISEPEVTTRTLEVAPHMSTCWGMGPTLCLQVREPGASTWEHLYETPDGFAFAWGIEKTIIVEEWEIENPPQDGSSIGRRVIEVLDERPVPEGTQWTMTTPSLAITPDDDDQFSLFGSFAQIRCHPDGACAALSAASDEEWLDLTLQYPEVPDGPLLVLSAVVCGTEPFCGI